MGHRRTNCGTLRGYTLYTCACGDSYIYNYVAALGHDYDSLSDNECNRCGYNRNTGGIIITPPDPDYPIIVAGISDVETTSETASDRVLISTNSEQHNYIYASGKLLREVITTGEGATATTQALDFFYDANGTPLALKTNNAVYYYVTNLQGDVIQLVDSTGTAVATYEYDPYGNIVSQTGDLADLNPLRYRGYYYDKETGFYYLQSRYYDPKIGRFINADSYASTGQGFTGYNMFAYCLNNPVIYTDFSGDVAQICHSDDQRMSQTGLKSIVGGMMFIVGALLAHQIIASTYDSKPVNLPARKKMKIDKEHVASGHMPGGSRNPDGHKSVFWGMTLPEVLQAIYEAYSNASKLQTQGDRIKIHGYSETYKIVIEMWINIVEHIIETAYPK